jgi:hypothetical protein
MFWKCVQTISFAKAYVRKIDESLSRSRSTLDFALEAIIIKNPTLRVFSISGTVHVYTSWCYVYQECVAAKLS